MFTCKASKSEILNSNSSPCTTTSSASSSSNQLSVTFKQDPLFPCSFYFLLICQPQSCLHFLLHLLWFYGHSFHITLPSLPFLSNPLGQILALINPSLFWCCLHLDALERIQTRTDLWDCSESGQPKLGLRIPLTGNPSCFSGHTALPTPTATTARWKRFVWHPNNVFNA